MHIADGRVELDLPPDAELDEIVAFHRRMGRGDGIERIAEDGTVTFTEEAQAALGPIDPRLAEPLSLENVTPRYELLVRHLNL